MKKAGWTTVLLACVTLILASPERLAAQDKTDTSTAADWKTNCACHTEYRTKLMFSASETTTADGKRTVAWAAMNRTRFVAVFKKLVLDRVPALKKRRDTILAGIARAPGGRRVVLLPELHKMINRFWDDIDTAAAKHGVICQPKKK